MGLVSKMKRVVLGAIKPQPLPAPVKTTASQRELIDDLALIPYWETKIERYKSYSYSTATGRWSRTGATSGNEIARDLSAKAGKVHYGCGGTLLDGWLNVDLFDLDDPRFEKVNLLEKHPIGDDVVSFGYSEDMVEHLTQAQSIFFLAEAYRCLKPGGVLRLSFPGLEGVLKRHYSPPTELRVREGEFEAYAFWDHIHFYSKEELRVIAEHIGYSAVDFVEYGVSRHPELRNLDTRAHQMDLNTYAELTK